MDNKEIEKIEREITEQFAKDNLKGKVLLAGVVASILIFSLGIPMFLSYINEIINIVIGVK